MSDYEPDPIDTDDGTDGDDSEAAGTGTQDLIAAFPRWLQMDDMETYARWYVREYL